MLRICFWRKGREERNWVEFMGEKGGYEICPGSVRHDIGERALIGTCQFALQGEDIVHEGYWSRPWDLPNWMLFRAGVQVGAGASALENFIKWSPDFGVGGGVAGGRL